MAPRIEDYALLGDCRTAALVSREGSIDWLCLPRFDSGACFAALLGEPDHGRWLLAPEHRAREVTRSYRDGSLVLDTTHRTDDGDVVVTDAMAPADGPPTLVRSVRGVRGKVRMRTEMVVRFDYGSIVPWVRKADDGCLVAVGGADALLIHAGVPLHGEGLTTVGDFDVSAGETVTFSLCWVPSHRTTGRKAPDVAGTLEDAEKRGDAWASRCTYRGRYRRPVLRSLVTLAALTHRATGAIVAAPTTSLPESLGGTRNWDYRFCWLRDATFTLMALAHNGYLDEAKAWREWLLRAVAGDPKKLQILYGVRGERRISEQDIPWLPGYEGAHPVRVGNAAHEQQQIDVYGEVLDSMYQCQRLGLEAEEPGWDLMAAMLESLGPRLDQPDHGIWEVRGPPRHFTHSKVMAWVAFDRGVRLVEELGALGPSARWRAQRDRLHAEICARGYDAKVGAFVQSYGSTRLDASLLLVPLVGFLPIDDPRVRSTAKAIEKRLLHGGFVRRYESATEVDGLPPGEGVFLPCSFWLADNWALDGRREDALALYDRLLALRNDVGLLAEEYDPEKHRMLGNFPQAFTHVSLVNTALNLAHAEGERAGPAKARSEPGD